ncbi:unnamed protein product [Gongylonema pulchrum]|uniref:Uncharacterized protein n=1 Tax=Gongylonema pulchrum TaxID=637853 RepID=A0A183EP36_9BILA|nr:unnamed protein product [Gongylonema pulchrum]
MYPSPNACLKRVCSADWVAQKQAISQAATAHRPAFLLLICMSKQAFDAVNGVLLIQCDDDNGTADGDSNIGDVNYVSGEAPHLLRVNFISHPHCVHSPLLLLPGPFASEGL